MAEILTISSILVNNANEISNILIVSALLIAFVISISEYGKYLLVLYNAFSHTRIFCDYL